MLTPRNKAEKFLEDQEEYITPRKELIKEQMKRGTYVITPTPYGNVRELNLPADAKTIIDNCNAEIKNKREETKWDINQIEGLNQEEKQRFVERAEGKALTKDQPFTKKEPPNGELSRIFDKKADIPTHQKIKQEFQENADDITRRPPAGPSDPYYPPSGGTPSGPDDIPPHGAPEEPDIRPNDGGNENKDQSQQSRFFDNSQFSMKSEQSPQDIQSNEPNYLSEISTAEIENKDQPQQSRFFNEIPASEPQAISQETTIDKEVNDNIDINASPQQQEPNYLSEMSVNESASVQEPSIDRAPEFDSSFTNETAVTQPKDLGKVQLENEPNVMSDPIIDEHTADDHISLQEEDMGINEEEVSEMSEPLADISQDHTEPIYEDVAAEQMPEPEPIEEINEDITEDPPASSEEITAFETVPEQEEKEQIEASADSKDISMDEGPAHEEPQTMEKSADDKEIPQEDISDFETPTQNEEEHAGYELTDNAQDKSEPSYLQEIPDQNKGDEVALEQERDTPSYLEEIPEQEVSEPMGQDDIGREEQQAPSINDDKE